jgi:hypothetical protein
MRSPESRGTGSERVTGSNVTLKAAQKVVGSQSEALELFGGDDAG